MIQKKVKGIGVGIFSLIILTAIVGISIPPAYAEVSKVAIVTDALFSDQGWGTAAYKAITAVQVKHGFRLGTAEGVNVPDIESTLRDFAERDYELIIAHGFQWSDPALAVGKDYPNTKIVVFTGFTSGPNVASIFPMQQEGTFPLGALAAMMSKTGVVGFVGGEPYPNLINIVEGYKAGAMYVNPDVKVIISWTGDWDDPAKGREAANAQIAQGADVLFHTADTAGHGMIRAAQDKGLYAFGAVLDQWELAPDTVLSSFVLDIEKSFDMAYIMADEGKFREEMLKPGIETGPGGPGDGIVYMAPFHDLSGDVPQDVKDRLDAIVLDIQTGRLNIPETYEFTAEDESIVLTFGAVSKVALVTDALLSDQGWGTAAYNAIIAVQAKYGFELGTAEGVNVPDIESTLRDFAERDYELIIAHGFQWSDPALAVGKDYPNTKIVVFTGFTSGPNVASIFPMQQEGTFPLGALAAMMTKTDVVGFIGGDPYPNLINIFEGYKAGANYINPDVEVLVSWTSDWDDPAKGRFAANAQIAKGADVLFHTADTTGHGMIRAAQDEGLYAFGAVLDQWELAPDTILSSFVLDIEKSFDMAYVMTNEGKFREEMLKPGIESGPGGPGDGVVYLAPFHDLADDVPQDVKDRLDAILTDIQTGRLVIPETYSLTDEDEHIVLIIKDVAAAPEKEMMVEAAVAAAGVTKVALVTDALLSDQGWGTAAYNAIIAVQAKYGFELGTAEGVNVPDIESTLRDFAERDYELIIAHGFQWSDPALAVGKDYPNTKIVVFTGFTSGPNVASIFPMQQEGTFPLGALAAMMSKTGVVGFVGGEPYPNLINIVEGYKAGAMYVNPDVKVIISWTGDWDDPAKGREAANAQIAQGADVLFHTADTAGHGMIRAAQDKGLYAFGAVLDQWELAPDTVLSSFVLDIEKSFDMAYTMTNEGKFREEMIKPGIETGPGGPGDGIVYVAPFHDLSGDVPQDVKNKLDAIVLDIQKGRLVIPETYEFTAEGESSLTVAVAEVEPPVAEVEPPVAEVEPPVVEVEEPEAEVGGCLIATAAFGSEMAPQVQLLREIRDNTILQTESGSAFMTGFNAFYYSFSPAIADYERENPAFKETVKLTLTPLLTSLTLLQYADIDSESEMLGYGISVILLNIGMYFVAPAVLVMAVRKKISNK